MQENAHNNSRKKIIKKLMMIAIIGLIAVGLLSCGIAAEKQDPTPDTSGITNTLNSNNITYDGQVKEVYLAGGCFWGLQKYMSLIPGVVDTEVGYANGKTENPSYEEVSRGKTGHAETVKVVYAPEKISLGHILFMYFDVIDPTSLNRQGNDMGPQYRTGIYYTDEEDLPVIEKAMETLRRKYDGSSGEKRGIMVEVKPLDNYYAAEDYHQDYLDKNPGGYCHIGDRAFEKAKKAIVDPSLYEMPSEEELKTRLTDLQYHVARESGTEYSFNNEYFDHFEEGIYVDIATGEPLFSSADKYSAGGWPAFTKPIDPSAVWEQIDLSFGMVRVEVRSRVGNNHLGHVFTDGPKDQGGLHYCINSAVLRFIPKTEMEAQGYAYLLPYLHKP